MIDIDMIYDIKPTKKTKQNFKKFFFSYTSRFYVRILNYGQTNKDF